MPEELTVMVVDTSARAEAVADSYLRSHNIKRVILPDKNQLIKQFAKKEVVLVPMDIKDPQTALAAARKYKPDLIDVCQDDALALGTVDTLQDNGFPDTFGPSADAAEIESSKVWSRRFQAKYEIPHPYFIVSESLLNAEDNAREIYMNNPEAVKWLKADGLCAGKGAIRCSSLDETLVAIETLRGFGKAGEMSLFEDNIENSDGTPGEEVSLYTFSDGVHTHTIKAAQDNKRQLNFDEGPNTGGMGVITNPMVLEGSGLMPMIQRDIVNRAISGMREEGRKYVGVLYSGLMLTDLVSEKPKAKVVEFNARWGAPEGEGLIPGIITPMDVIALACIHGKLNEVEIEEDNKYRVVIVGASKNYPGDYGKVKGKEVFGLREANAQPGIEIFGAGIKVDRDTGRHYAIGGRLFSLVAKGNSLIEARAIAMHAMAMIHVEGNNLQYRFDIGFRDVERSYLRER